MSSVCFILHFPFQLSLVTWYPSKKNMGKIQPNWRECAFPVCIASELFLC